jgi:hypothetical protein
VSDEGDTAPGRVVPVDEGHAEDRPGRRAHCPRAERIGALGREGDRSTESVGRPHQRPDVSRIRDPPEPESHVPRPDRQVGAPKDSHDARGMPERRHLGEKLGDDVFPCDEQLDRLDRRVARRLDEVFALDREEPVLFPVLARREELPDEPELLVLAGLDQAADASASSEAFARSATRANAAGSDTARSASDFRSSSIPASRTPAMNLL